MTNLVRKALRVCIDHLQQLRDDPSVCQLEAEEINRALVSLVRADYFDMHVKPGFRYRVPKTDFVYHER